MNVGKIGSFGIWYASIFACHLQLGNKEFGNETNSNLEMFQGVSGGTPCRTKPAFR
jgi:hypothetical protein